MPQCITIKNWASQCLRIVSVGLLLAGTQLAQAQNFRVEVPLDNLSARTLIEVVEARKERLGSSILYEEFKNVATDPITESSISCWTWIYRKSQLAFSHGESRLECRWIYGNNTGLGVFSWRLPNAVVSPVGGAVDTLSFEFAGDDVRPMVEILKEARADLEKTGRAQVEGQSLALVQSENRFPRFSCELESERCRFTFHAWRPEEFSFPLGAASKILAEVIMNDERLMPYLRSSFGPMPIGAKLLDATCVFRGMHPERGQFNLQAASSIECEALSAGGPGHLSLDLSETATQSWGSRFQGYRVASLLGSVTKALYHSLRERAERGDTTLLYTDDLDIGNIYKSVRMRRIDDREVYPDVALECVHEIYRDPFTELYRRYFPDTYLGRVEYYKCLFKEARRD